MSQTREKASSTAASNRRQRRELWTGIGLLALTFLLYSIAFPPFNLWPAIFLAPVPLAMCALGRPASWRWLLGYYGLGAFFFAVNLFWLYTVAPGGVVALSLFCGLYFAAFAWAFRCLVVQLRWPALVALPLVWVACEYVRSTLFTGFAWFLLGNAVVSVPALIQIADLFGVWSVSFVVAMTAGLIVDILRLPLSRNPSTKSKMSRLNPAVTRLVAAYVGAIIIVLAYGLFRLHEPGVHYAGLKVATVQEYIPQSIKDSKSPEEKQQMFQRHANLSLAAAAEKPDLIAWPETIIPEEINREWLQLDPSIKLSEVGREYLARARDYDAQLKKLSDAIGAYLLVGSPGWDPISNQRQNLAVLYSPGHGQVYPYYAKRHLVPFGEFIPFTGIPWLHQALLYLTPSPDYDYSLTPGDSWLTFEVLPLHATSPLPEPARFGVPICYEDVMPYPCRSFVAPIAGRKGADFLISISNDGWYDLWHNVAELDQHMQMTQMRAVENRVPIVRSVNAGNSGFIDSSGRIVSLVEKNGVHQYVAGQRTETLVFDRRMSLYSRIGDVFGVVAGILTALAVAYTVVRPRLGKNIRNQEGEAKES